MRSMWDICQVDPTSTAKLSLLQRNIDCFKVSSKSTKNQHETETPGIQQDDTKLLADVISAGRVGDVHNMKEVLQEANESCSEAIINLDSILTVLDEIKDEFYAVTGRTNMLMSKCESLLEEQRTLQDTVEQLRELLKPFQDIEDTARTLGITYENPSSTSGRSVGSTPNAASNKYSLDGLGSSNLDPRSPEFQDLLNKLQSAQDFLIQHPEIRDSGKYLGWLEKLQIRTISLVGRSMRDLLEKANKQCRDIIQQKINNQKQLVTAGSHHDHPGGHNNSNTVAAGKYLPDEQPLESLPIYSKFRSLAYRMKELLGVLFQQHKISSNSNSDLHRLNTFDELDSHKSTTTTPNQPQPHKLVHDQMILQEVKKGYSVIRMDLLPTYLQDVFLLAIHHNATTVDAPSPSPASTASTPSSASSSSSTASSASSPTTLVSLSGIIRHAFTSLLRMSQLEYQLFDLLFNLHHHAASTHYPTESISRSLSMDSHQQPSSSSKSISSGGIQDLLRIIEMLLHYTHDFLRPLIIRESKVDELCRVVSALSEDIQSQIMIYVLPPAILKTLSQGLESILNDTKERLIYIAELTLRQEIVLFEPLPSQLAYPDILDQYQASSSSSNGLASHSTSTTEFQNISLSDATTPSLQSVDVYTTWYPPMKHTLSLLSKLYNIVDMTIFEDFATRSISYCLQALQAGSEQIKKRQLSIHGDLFFIRHLLILREQLIPFEIKLLNVEKSLDFRKTNQAIHDLLASTTTAANSRLDQTSTNGTSGATISYLTRNLLRLDSQNLLIQLAQQGVPTMKESQQDMKKELDNLLKKACASLKVQAMKLLIHGLEQWIVKVTAFVGEIPIDSTSNINRSMSQSTDQYDSSDKKSSLKESNKALLVPGAVATIKNQAFVKAERIKEMLEQVQSLLVNKMPDFLVTMKLYIENPVTRNILMKSIIQEYELIRKRVECVIASCVEKNNPLLREIEQSLHVITHTIVSELSNAST